MTQKTKNNKIADLFESKKIIAIALDCGFDGVKICINGKLLAFPSYIFPLTSDNELIMSGSSESDRILYSEISTNRGASSYVIGDTAKSLINGYPADGKYHKLISDLKSLDVFFQMEESVYMIRAAIAYSLIKYAGDNDIGFTLEDLNAFTIYLDLALPHSLYHKAYGYLKGPLSRKTSINIGVDNETYKIDLDIKSEHISGSSQVLDVFTDLSFGFDGERSIPFSDLLDMLPVVICDGGYRTQGLATIRKETSLMVEKVSSYQEYAMIEVDKEAAKTINDKVMKDDVVNYEPIMEYDIDANIRRKTDFNYMVRDDSTSMGLRRKCVKFDEIQAIKESILDKTAANYCKFLISSYGILNAKTIIVAGGTGAAFSETIKKYVADFAGDTTKVILLEDTHNGKAISPVFTIVLGSYKYLINNLIKGR